MISSIPAEVKKIKNSLPTLPQIRKTILNTSNNLKNYMPSLESLITPSKLLLGGLSLASLTYESLGNKNPFKTPMDKLYGLCPQNLQDKISYTHKLNNKAYQILDQNIKHGFGTPSNILLSSCTLQVMLLIDDHLSYHNKNLIKNGGIAYLMYSLVSHAMKEVHKDTKKTHQDDSKEKKVEKLLLPKLKETLNKKVVDQTDAVNALHQMVHSYASVFKRNQENKTAGNIFFAGATGVGKTQLAKEFAQYLGRELVTIDMSQFSGHSSDITALTGSQGVWVGSQAGLLTEPVKKNPQCVLLLDEIANTPKKVHDILYRLLDEGKLYDKHLKEDVDFSNVFIIMTGNCAFDTRKCKHDVPSANSVFMPPFLGRIPHKVDFNGFSQEMAEGVIKNELDALETYMNKHETNKTNNNCINIVHDKVITYITEQYDTQSTDNKSIRGLKAYCNTILYSPLIAKLEDSTDVLNNKKITIDIKNNKLVFEG